MLPLVVAIIQELPVVTILKLKGDRTVVVGVPLIVKVLPVTVAVTPAGKPVTVAPVAPPPRVYTIGDIGVLMQTV